MLDRGGTEKMGCQGEKAGALPLSPGTEGAGERGDVARAPDSQTGALVGARFFIPAWW